MTETQFVGLAALIFVAATLHSMVGHGGSSAYLAAMALFGVAPASMKPTALVLNILVASLATIQFARAGYFDWSRFWPFAITSIPFAFFGGGLSLSEALYRRLIGALLVYAAIRLYMTARVTTTGEVKPIPRALAMPIGAAIGWLSGLIGVGGALFFSPVLLLARWANVRTTSAVAAAFTLVNSIAGLLGHLGSVRELSPGVGVLAAAAIAGGSLGATVGSRRILPPAMRRLLAIVLALAALKLFLVRT